MAKYLPFIFIFSSPLYAASGGGSFLGLPVWVWLIVNLIIFWGFIIYYLGPAVVEYLTNLRESIKVKFVSIEQKRLEIENIDEKIKRRVREFEREKERIIELAKREAERERARILKRARVEEARIHRKIEEEFQRRLKQAKVELAEYATELATRTAKDEIEKRIKEKGEKLILAKLSAIDFEEVIR